jgi:hypothetical protein
MEFRNEIICFSIASTMSELSAFTGKSLCRSVE